MQGRLSLHMDSEAPVTHLLRDTIRVISAVVLGVVSDTQRLMAPLIRSFDCQHTSGSYVRSGRRWCRLPTGSERGSYSV